jgi:hypothetical protein
MAAVEPKVWHVYLFCKRAEYLGTVEAANETAA